MFLNENKFCIECGTLLVKKEVKDEGLIGYCSHCDDFQFDPFNTAVSCIIINPHQDKILLVKQYGLDHYRFVAGYINKGENAQECLIREIKEELNQEVIRIVFNDTAFFNRTNTLMINFIVTLESEDVSEHNYEIDQADWFSFDEAKRFVKPNSLAELFLRKFLLERAEDYGR
jgi:NAD+ diphosphatase